MNIEELLFPAGLDGSNNNEHDRQFSSIGEFLYPSEFRKNITSGESTDYIVEPIKSNEDSSDEHKSVSV